MKRKNGKHINFIGVLIAAFILMNGLPTPAMASVSVSVVAPTSASMVTSASAKTNTTNASQVLDKLNQIVKRYPSGSFFSVDGQACTHTHALTCSNCELLNIYPDLKGKVSNAWTCCAFARYVYYELFQINSYGISANSKEVSLADAKAGDLVMFYSGLSITHYAIFLNSDGVNRKYYLYESNYVVPNRVRYGGAFSAAQLANVKIWHANNYVTDDLDAGGSLTTPAAIALPTPVPTTSSASAFPAPSPTSTTATPTPMSTSSTTTLTPSPTPSPSPSQTPTSTSLPVPASNPGPVTSAIPAPKPAPTLKPKPTQLPLPIPKPAPIVRPTTGKNTRISVVKIKISKARLELGMARTFQLYAIIVAQNISTKKVIWLSGNRSIATVNTSGKVKGIKKGSTYIYAISVDGRKEAKCLVIVN